VVLISTFIGSLLQKPPTSAASYVTGSTAMTSKPRFD